MISKRKHFELDGRCILEMLIVDGPHRISVDFPNEACYLYLRGGEMIVNSAVSTSRMAPRDGVVLNCGNYFADFLQSASSDQSQVFAIHLYPDLLRELFRDEIPAFVRADNPIMLPVKAITHEVMDRFFESILFYFDHPEVATDDIMKLKVRELILLLIQSHHAPNIHDLFTSLFTHKVVSVADVVNHHLYDNLNVEELARLAGLSITSFKTAFNKLFNEPPARYIRRKRIERAKELLQVSDYTVGQIADQTGFHDISHFSKSFHTACGCSPGAYRDQSKQ